MSASLNDDPPEAEAGAGFALPWWLSLPSFESCFRSLTVEEPLPEQEYEVVVYSRRRDGEVVHGAEESNHVTTAKYTLFSLVPLTFFIQFRRKANVYFFGITALGAIADYVPGAFDSTMNISAMIVAIMMIFGAAMIKEGVDDYYRGQDDKRFNEQPFVVLEQGTGQGPGGFEEKVVHSKDIAVASLVKVVEGESFPVDMLFLLSSEPDHGCYVDTKNLDGETNLKKRVACGGGWFGTEPELLGTDLELTYSPPTPALGAFVGTLRNASNEEARPVGVDNLLLRGTCLRNTKWVVGVVVYNGDRTKLALNLIESPAKRSSLDTQTDGVMIAMFVCQFALVTFATVCYVVFNRNGNARHQWYLCSGDLNSSPDVDTLFAENCSDNDGSQAWYQQWLSFLILYNNFISISLYLMMEFAVVVQALFIGHDLEMYYEEFDSPALARNSNLTTDLGRVDFVFSDKTGTLTQNEMTLKFCTLHQLSLSSDEMMHALRGSTQLLDGEVTAAVHALLVAIAVNHTLVVVGSDAAEGSAGQAEPKAQALNDDQAPFPEMYLAESPDEKALVEGARRSGVRLLSRDGDECVVQTAGQAANSSFKVLAVIPFSSARKRMSVLVAAADDPGQLTLVCKGADSVLLDNLSCSCERIGGRASIDRALTGYSVEGLRTLVYAERKWPKQQAEEWLQRWNVALGSSVNQAARLEELAAEAERDLHVLGATAVEDKLQEGVPETMADLKQADIKVWVLTGDKTDTAINIAHSCRLLDSSTHLVKLTGLKGASLKRYLRMWARAFQKLDVRPNVAAESAPVHQDLTVGLNSERLCALYDSPLPHESNPLTAEGLSAAISSLTGAGHERATDSFVRALNEPLLQQGHAGAAETPGVDEGPPPGATGRWGVACTSDGAAVLTPGQAAAAPKERLAIVVDGGALDQIFGNLELEAMLFTVASSVGVVVACRVSPKHKSLMVKLVKEWSVRLPLTLAIGDGANDVAMIQEAHVGVGISGKEGRQAVNSSDYAICQFRYLKRLLFVHGRWNIDRTSKLVWFQIQQNVTLVVPLIAFTAVCSWSGTIAYTEFGYQFFNFYLGVPVLFLAWFDRSEPAEALMSKPSLYVAGRENPLLSPAGIMRMVLRCVTDGLLVFFGTATAYGFGTWQKSGYNADIAQFSFLMINALFFVMFSRLVRMHCTIGWFTVAGLAFGLALFIGSLFFVSALAGSEAGFVGWIASFLGSSYQTYQTANLDASTWVYWFVLAFVLSAILLLDVLQLTILDRGQASWVHWGNGGTAPYCCDARISRPRSASGSSATNGRVGMPSVTTTTPLAAAEADGDF